MSLARRATTLAAGLLLAPVVAGCGSSSSGSSAPPAVAANAHTVTIQNFMFSPMSLTVSAGTTVTWVQDDTTPHTVTGSGSSSFIHSNQLNKGQTYSVTFSKAGTYSYMCSIHPNMKGTVVVQ